MLTIIFIVFCVWIWCLMVKTGCRDIKKGLTKMNQSDWTKSRMQKSNLKWQEKNNTMWWQEQQKKQKR